MTEFWTIERIDILRQRKAEGKSSSAIAAEIGATRNAVIGKWLRIMVKQGYKPKPKIRNMDAPKPIPKDREPRLAAPAGIILPAILPPAPRSGPAIGILDVTGCKWAVAEEPGLIGSHAFCNAPRKEGDSRYCPHHAARAKGSVPPGSWVKVAA